MFYVYKITNTVNGKVYIGMSKNVQKRWKGHILLSKCPESHKHHLIHKSIAKYGQNNFTFQVIETCNSQQEAFYMETVWIHFHKSNASKYGSKYGYNLTDGGECPNVVIFTADIRKKMSDSHLGIQAGEKHPMSKLTTTDVINIFDMIISGMSDAKIASNFGVIRKSISNIRMNKAWKHIPRPVELSNEFTISQRLLTKQDIPKIILLINSDVDDHIIAKQFSVSYSTIRRIRLGESWKDIPR